MKPPMCAVNAIGIPATGAVTSPGTNPHFADITYKLQVM
jgi:hypothetical protein